MDDKANKGKMRRMNKEEFAYNKHLLREINDKRKASNYESQSRAEEGNDNIWLIGFVTICQNDNL